MFYIPNLPYAFYLAIKAKHPAFFSAANPGIKSSGNGTESKFQTIQLVPEEFRPKTVLIPPKTNFNEVLQLIKNAEIDFPLIAKPDIGFRGLLVKKIDNKEELKYYLQHYPIDILLQEFLNYKNECGIFYHRKPNEQKGKITSITLKKFISVLGDGVHTLEELIVNDTRAKHYIELFKTIHKNKFYEIPKQREEIKLSVIGNHSKGTQFINGNHLISASLTKTFDKLSHNTKGWYYGRVDIKYDTFEDLEQGKNYKVLEINGIIAEPTHIYDAENYTYFKALKEIRTHWESLYHVATENHKSFNIPYKSPKLFLKEMFELKKYISAIKKLQ